MAKSKPKKQRIKMIQEGGRDPQISQSIYTKCRDGYNLTAQKTSKNKKDIQQREYLVQMQRLKQAYKNY